MVTSYLIWWFLTQIKRDKPSFSLFLTQAEFNKVYLKINYDQTSSLNVHIVLIWQEEEFEFGLQLKFKGRLYYKKCQEIVYIMNNHEKTPTHTRWRSKYRNIVVIKLNCKCSEQCEGVFWWVLSTWSAPYNLTNLKNYHAKYSNNELLFVPDFVGPLSSPTQRVDPLHGDGTIKYFPPSTQTYLAK